MDYTELAELLKAIAHPARLQILDLLRSGEVCVCHIERALNRRQAYISQQLMVLRDSGLLETRKDGLKVYYRIVNERLRGCLDVMLNKPYEPEIKRLDGCPCPLCSTVSIESIQ